MAKQGASAQTAHTPVLHPGDRIKEGDWFVVRGYYGYQLCAYRAGRVTAKQVFSEGLHARRFDRVQIAGVLCSQADAEALVDTAREIDRDRSRRHSEANTDAAKQLAEAILKAESSHG